MGSPVNAERHFKMQSTCQRTRARCGALTTLHGNVQTPVFLPVGSQATVRALTPDDLVSIGFEIILCNNYHLYLRPGIDIIKKAGGLHSFMGWSKPILTDSGGYQIFSLSSFRKITSDGITFRSHIDGSEHHVTPEYAVELQEQLGSDIAMALDVCPISTERKEKLMDAVRLTHEWAKRCVTARSCQGQLLFGIIQGGIHPELRKMSSEQITELDFDGYAIGGLSVGESKEAMWSAVEATVEYMPTYKPRYLMGVGSPEDLLEGIARGIDIFDSALPTRVARNGALYTRTGRINIKKSKYQTDFNAIEEHCGCYTCNNFSAAYLHHLFKCEELLAYRLATIHNLHFMNSLVLEIRQSIVEDRFESYKMEFIRIYQTTDETNRMEQKNRYLNKRHAEDG